jgi:hypothetical protein
MLPGLAPTISESDLDGLAPESFLSRRQRTSTYNKIHGVLADLRRDRISPVDLLIQVLDPNDLAYDRYRGSLYRDESNKLMQLLDTIMADRAGHGKLSHLEELACETVADEMAIRRRNCPRHRSCHT